MFAIRAAPKQAMTRRLRHLLRLARRTQAWPPLPD